MINILLSTVIAISFFSISLFAEEETILEKADQKIDNTVDQVKKSLDETKDRRAQSKFFILGNWAPYDLIIPSKFGATLGLVRSEQKTWELEYMRGSVSVPSIIEDLGKMTDTRISLMARSYSDRNSFNLSYGLSYFDFSMTLGDKLLNRVTGGNYPALDLVQVQSLGAHFGIGNRWVFKKNFTLGVDWISWSQPLIILKKNNTFADYATNKKDKDDVETAVNIISYFPRISALKLQLGFSF